MKRSANIAEFGTTSYGARQRLNYRVVPTTSSSRRFYVRKASYGRYKRKSLYRLGGRMPPGSGELKDITNNFTPANILAVGSAVGTLNLCNGVAQGTTANTRLGRRIRIRSITVRAALYKAATQTLETALRFVLVYDMQANGTAPLATDILQSDQIAGVMNLNNANRFKILMDKTACIGAVDNTAVNITKYLKGDWITQFNAGSAGTIGDIQTGSIYLLVYGPNIGVAVPNGAFTVRVRFSDN